MNTDHAMDHSFQDFVNGLYLTIRLGVIRCRVFMTKTQLGTELAHHVVPKVGPMIGHDGLWNTEPRNNVVKYE